MCTDDMVKEILRLKPNERMTLIVKLVERSESALFEAQTDGDKLKILSDIISSLSEIGDTSLPDSDEERFITSSLYVFKTKMGLIYKKVYENQPHRRLNP